MLDVFSFVQIFKISISYKQKYLGNLDNNTTEVRAHSPSPLQALVKVIKSVGTGYAAHGIDQHCFLSYNVSIPVSIPAKLLAFYREVVMGSSQGPVTSLNNTGTCRHQKTSALQ